MYAITANRIIKDKNGTRTLQLPTFDLDENLLGISNPQQAEMIARNILSLGLDHIQDTKTVVTHEVLAVKI